MNKIFQANSSTHLLQILLKMEMRRPHLPCLLQLVSVFNSPDLATTSSSLTLRPDFGLVIGASFSPYSPITCTDVHYHKGEEPVWRSAILFNRESELIVELFFTNIVLSKSEWKGLEGMGDAERERVLYGCNPPNRRLTNLRKLYREASPLTSPHLL
jgi:hypothetical protein